MALSIFKDNLNPSLADTITIDGVAVDLTGATVKLQMRTEDDTAAALVVDAVATIVTAAAGSVRYDWVSADVDTIGDYLGWWHVIFPSGRTQDTPEFAISIVEHTPGSPYIVELAEVRDALELKSADTSQDDPIRRLLPVVTRAIAQWTQREFTPTSGATRRFRTDGRLVILAPYDLRAATTVTFDPASGPAVMTAPNDYRLQPTNRPDGVYTELRISDLFAIQTGTWVQFGFNEVEIVGDWGFASVPVDVREAAVIAVRSWLRRDTSTYAAVDAEMRQLQPEAFGTYKLPPASKAMLDPYKRMVV